MTSVNYRREGLAIVSHDLRPDTRRREVNQWAYSV